MPVVSSSPVKHPIACLRLYHTDMSERDLFDTITWLRAVADSLALQGEPKAELIYLDRVD